MSATAARASGQAPAPPAPPMPTVSQARAFMAVLRGDLFVTGKDLHVFLAQVILQPLFLLLVFGKVLGALGYTRGGYAHLLFRGLLALTAVITSMQTLAFPLVVEFGWTKEIEDRLLAPMATGLVAMEKVLFASMRALVATTVMIAVGILVLGSIPWRWSGLPLLIAALVLGRLLGAGSGSCSERWSRRVGSTWSSRSCSRRCCSRAAASIRGPRSPGSNGSRSSPRAIR